MFIRIVYLATAAVMLGYLGTYQERLQSQLTLLATWRPSPPSSLALPIREWLEHASALFGTARILIIWEHSDEPWVNVSSFINGKFEESRRPPDYCQPIADKTLEFYDFLYLDTGSGQPLVITSHSGRLEQCHAWAIHPYLKAEFGIKSAVAVHIIAESMSGRLFILDVPELLPDDLAIGGIVATHIAAEMDRFELLCRLRDAAATEERIRLARDLHDGVLQSLAGIAIQLCGIEHVLKGEQAEVRNRLRGIQQTLEGEQRELRHFVRHLKPNVNTLHEESLRSQIEFLVARLREQWHLKIELFIVPENCHVSAELRHHIFRILSEAIANAARHGNATTITINIEITGGEALIHVRDNGRGFPFSGTISHADLVRNDIGPRSLCERVQSLGGKLTIDSSSTGAEVRIILPR